MEKVAVRSEHLTLLRHAYVGWNGCEWGAPSIDCKRPYGNGDIVGDIAKLVGITPIETDDGPVWPKGTHDKCMAWHAGTQKALQIVLATGEFRTGIYQEVGREWKRIGDVDPVSP